MVKSLAKTRPLAGYVSALGAPLIQLGAKDAFTLAQACQGVQIFGGTGSGKTSGSGRAFAHAYLRHGFGGLVLCAKPGEAALWQRYAEETGRTASILRIGEGSPWKINFLDYILRKDGIAALNNAISALQRVAEASRLAKDTPTGDGAQFWEDAYRQALMNSVPLLYSALGRVTLGELYRLLQSAPQSEAEATSPSWQADSFFYEVAMKARDNPVFPLSPQALQACGAYWRFDFARLDPKTRSNIIITLTSLLSRFSHGRLHDLFCTHTTVVPDLCFDGTIIILDMPVKTWQEDGIVAQHIFKFLWQRAVEARAAQAIAGDPRPVFLWADESQFFVNSYDPEFQSTARSARACTVFITQSLPTYYAKIGGQNPEHFANMLLANLMTRVFHANGCQITNGWAADAIGKRLVMRAGHSWGSTDGGSSSHTSGSNRGNSWNFGGGPSNSIGPNGSSYTYQSSTGRGSSEGSSRSRQTGKSWGTNEGGSLNEQMDYVVDPSVFASDLRMGGAESGGLVDAVWVQAGKQFSYTRDMFMPVTFRQEAAR